MSTDAQGMAYRLAAMIRVTQMAAENDTSGDLLKHRAADLAAQLEALDKMAGDLIDMIELDMLKRERPEAETQTT